MQCSQAEKRSHGNRRASSASSSPPSPDGSVISSAGEMLLASWSSRSSGSSSCSPSSSGPCRAMATRQKHTDALECWIGFLNTFRKSSLNPSGQNKTRKAGAQKVAKASKEHWKERENLRAYLRQHRRHRVKMRRIQYRRVWDCPIFFQKIQQI